ncbi:MAG: SpoIIE family protein phosphatase [Bacteroidales bacterium]|nr:SpoIIE family protein phosphatase [Bacteroidales bacterium]
MASSSGSKKRLRLSTFKLKALLEITKSINENVSMQALLNQFSVILQDYLHIGKVVIYHHQDNWKIILRSGVSYQLVRKINFEKHIQPFTEIVHVTYQENDQLKRFDFIIPIFHKDKALAYVVVGDFDEETTGVSPSIKHLQFIQTLANIIIVAIENKILFKENLEKEAIKKEMELASRVQSFLIPQNESLPQNDKIFVEGYYHPHFEIGGDYYDFMSFGEDEFAFCIADVSGKGVSASLLMANFQANVRAMLRQKMGLRKMIKELNSIVLLMTKSERFITFFVGKYSFRTKQLQYVNAGHNPPFFFDGGKEKISYLENGTSGLGMVDNMPVIKLGKVKVSPNSILMAYTDGLVELSYNDEVSVRQEDIENLILTKRKISEVIYNIRFKIEQPFFSSHYFDDISILGIQFYK